MHYFGSCGGWAANKIYAQSAGVDISNNYMDIDIE